MNGTTTEFVDFAIEIDLTITDLDREMFSHPRWPELALALAVADNAEGHRVGASVAERLQRVAQRKQARLMRAVTRGLARPPREMRSSLPCRQHGHSRSRERGAGRRRASKSIKSEDSESRQAGQRAFFSVSCFRFTQPERWNHDDGTTETSRGACEQRGWGAAHFGGARPHACGSGLRAGIRVAAPDRALGGPW